MQQDRSENGCSQKCLVQSTFRPRFVFFFKGSGFSRQIATHLQNISATTTDETTKPKKKR